MVTRLTGWDVGLNTLGRRVLPKEWGCEELLLCQLEESGSHR